MIFKVGGALLRFTNYESSISVAATDVGDALTKLVDVHPDLREVIFDRSGSVRRTHRLCLNGTVLDHGDLDHELADGDRVDILTAVSGG